MHYQLRQPKEYTYPEGILRDYGCAQLSTYFEIHPNGDISICCFSWLPKFFGNILTQSPEEIVNNPERLGLIEDMTKGLYTECTDHCPFISSLLSGKTYPDSYIVPLEQLDIDRPIMINFSYDQSCNLQCPSCRNELILYKLGDNRKLDRIHDGVKNFVSYLAAQGYQVILKITGSGDAFGSPTYWNFLKQLAENPNDSISLSLHTNGTLMNEDRLAAIKPIWKHIQQINVSIDAATDSTYDIVRQNGSLEKVKANLSTLNQLIDQGHFPNMHSFMTNFTVQKRNYREVKAFLKWQLEYSNLTTIYFSLMQQWGHLSTKRFVSEFELSDIEKQELGNIIADPAFDDTRVILGNLYSFKDMR
jgi:MoaA/NifB/PqqE/SkfB family radical SAM enzyme